MPMSRDEFTTEVLELGRELDLIEKQQSDSCGELRATVTNQMIEMMET
jgi:hypothetical protein